MSGQDHPKLSVFIITLNEADRLPKALSSVQSVADEIIVIDSGSTDGTQEVAQSLGAQVIHNDWPGYGQQKRFGEDQCRNTWVLNLDADEALTPGLVEDIRACLQNPAHDGYRLFIADVFPHEDAPASFANGYWQIRLYNRDVGRFDPSTVHDAVHMPPGARVGKLKGWVEHRSQRSLTFSIEKMNRYSSMQRDDFMARGRRLPKWRLVTELPLSFLKSYILRGNYRYGWWGVVHAMTYGISRFLRVAKIYEMQLQKKGNPPHTGSI